jgi:predicted CXXCH cytochrome family protein
MVSASRATFSPHATRVVADFGGVAECSSCHQFNFPLLSEESGALIAYSEEPMQNTGAEAAAAGAECSSCHDPHRAAGSHAPGLVAAAMSTTVCRDGGEVVMRIKNSGAGHNLPTGGVHRFISARLWRSSAPARGVRLRLGREFGAGEKATRRTRVDSTIAAGQSRALRVAAVDLGGSSSEPVNADVRYHYALSEDAVLIDGSSAIKTIERQRFSVTDLEPCETH